MFLREAPATNVAVSRRDGYQAAPAKPAAREIKIKRYARVIEGHILDFKPTSAAANSNKSLLRKERIEMCTVKEI